MRCYNSGLSIASFEEKTVERLREKLPPAANFYDPVDVLGDAGADLYEHALDVVLDDINVNGISYSSRLTSVNDRCSGYC